jgi:hypothetical protein
MEGEPPLCRRFDRANELGSCLLLALQAHDATLADELIAEIDSFIESDPETALAAVCDIATYTPRRREHLRWDAIQCVANRAASSLEPASLDPLLHDSVWLACRYGVLDGRLLVERDSTWSDLVM